MFHWHLRLGAGWHIIYIGTRVGMFRLLFFVYIDDEGE